MSQTGVFSPAVNTLATSQLNVGFAEMSSWSATFTTDSRIEDMLAQDTDIKAVDYTTLSYCHCQKVSWSNTGFIKWSLHSPTQHFVYLDLSFRVSRNDIMADQCNSARTPGKCKYSHESVVGWKNVHYSKCKCKDLWKNLADYCANTSRFCKLIK